VLQPYFITGFCDAEGYFFIHVRENKSSKLGYRVDIGFAIGLHSKDETLLKSIKHFFKGHGYITKLGVNSLQYRVRYLNSLSVIIEHFNLYSLHKKRMTLICLLMLLI